MNLATIIALLIVLALFIPASIYLYKNGTCGSCPDHGACSGHCTHDLKRNLKKDPEYKEKNKQIDEIIKKHQL
ncbi:MAG: hypothetical protein J6I58_03380 [Eubacterium sp.]|nr:hypothetical protein [Eubacterium sp.]MBR1772805.1 hypothetical protein [Eubacterium sp.]